MTVFFHEDSRPLLVPIAQVKQYENNVNSGDVDAVTESIRASGFYGAVIAQAGTGTLIAGHTRYHALLELEADQIPVLWVHCDDVAAARIRLADNRTTRLGRDDPALLLEELENIRRSDLELIGTGYDNDYMETLRHSLAQPLEFDETEFAKQRSGHICECPRCGWRSDQGRN